MWEKLKEKKKSNFNLHFPQIWSAVLGRDRVDCYCSESCHQLLYWFPNVFHCKIIAINFWIMLTPLLFVFEIWQKRSSIVPFIGTVNKFRFGQVIEVLKITIFIAFSNAKNYFGNLLKFPEIQWVCLQVTPIASSWMAVVGWCRQNGSASPQRKFSVIGAGSRRPAWRHEMAAAASGTKKGKASHLAELVAI